MHQKRVNDIISLRKIAVLGLIFLTSCIRQPIEKVQPAPSEPEYLSHRITYSGETLGAISLWYTGDSSYWKAFYLPATSGAIRKLKRGDQILIPMNLVIRRETLTREFVRAHRQTSPLRDDHIAVEKPQPIKTVQAEEEPTIRDAIPAEIAPLEVESFEEKPSSTELEKEFIDRIVR